MINLRNDLRLSEDNLRIQFETNRELEHANNVNKDMYHDDLEKRDQYINELNEKLR